MIEYRVVCGGEGRQHRSHQWPKKDLKKAKQSVIDANHHAEMHPESFYAKFCAPYRIESREVRDWGPENG